MVKEIAPGTVVNDQPANLTLTGANFGSAVAVVVGGRSLQNVAVQSSTSLTARLPAGLCPGTDTASIVDAAGRRGSGGRIVVQGSRTVRFGTTLLGPAITLTGRDQTTALRLPAVHLRDTSCTSGSWRIAIAVSVPTSIGRRHSSLLPRAIIATWPSAPRPITIPLRAMLGAATAVLVVPHAAEQKEVNLRLTVDAVVPANTYAGQAAMHVSVTLLSAASPRLRGILNLWPENP